MFPTRETKITSRSLKKKKMKGDPLRYEPWCDDLMDLHGDVCVQLPPCWLAGSTFT